MAAKRMLAQSLAREVGPKGVHVAHVVLDGPVDTPFVRQLVGDSEFETMRAQGRLIQPDDVAATYWMLHTQPRSAWSHEIDLRPFCERF